MKRTIVIALIVVCMMFGVVAYATAGTPATATGPVTVSVTPNALILLSLSTDTVTFPAMDPGATSAVISVGVTVSSNKAWTMTKTPVGDVAMGLKTSLGTAGGGKGVTAMTDNYQIQNLPWTSDGGTPLTATVKYDVTQ